MHSSKKKFSYSKFFTLCLLAGLTPRALAINFTWTGSSSTDWNAPTNWNPSYGYPSSLGDSAIFPKISKSYNVSIPFTASPLALSALTFNGAYTLTNNNSFTLSSNNNAGIVGTSNIINNSYLSFEKTASAGAASITNNNGLWSYLAFYDTTNAGTAIITNSFLSDINFYNSASAGASKIINNGDLYFKNTSNAGNATITNKGRLVFFDSSDASQAIINNTGGTLLLIYRKGGLNINSLYELNSEHPGKIDLESEVNLSLGADNKDSSLYSSISGSSKASLTKVGDGKLTLYGVNSSFFDDSYSGKTIVDKGTLIVAKNGALENSPITVNKNGFLSFINHAYTSDSIDNFGMLSVSEANALNTLNITHDFISEAGSSYQVKIDNQGNSDSLYINGTATLNGGTVNISLLNNQYQTATPYTILTAGTLNGSFDNLVQPIGLNGELSYQRNQVNYQIKGLSNNLLKAASTPTQTTVAQQLFAMASTHLPVLNELIGLESTHELETYLDQLSGATYSNQQLAIAQASNWLDSHMRDQIQTSHQTEPKSWLLTRESVMKVTSFKNTLNALAYGVEAGDQEKLFGVSLAYTHLRGHSVDSNERSEAVGNLYQLGSYANQKLSNCLLGATLSLGLLDDVDAKRWVGQGLQTQGHYHGSLFSAQLEATHLGILQPLLGVHYQQLNRAQFAEQGNTGDELNLSRSHYKSLQSQLGLAFHTSLFQGVEPFAQATWEHELINTGKGFNASFESTGNHFYLNNSKIDPDALVAKLGVSVNPAKNWNLSALYEGYFDKNSRENAAKLQLEYALK